MSVSDWPAMRNRRPALLAAGCCILLALPLPAAEPGADATLEVQAPPPNQREYQPQALPDDTFSPSEEVSEDYPVPFPVDI